MDSKLVRADVDEIRIVYRGLDADKGEMDIAMLAKSLEGYGRILATSASFMATYVYRTHLDAMPMRITVREFKDGSFEVIAFLNWVKQSQLLPNLRDILKAVLDWVTARLANRKDEPQMKDIVLKMIEKDAARDERMDHLLEKMVDKLVPAARNAVAPIGESCGTTELLLGQDAITVWDESDKQTIIEKVRPAIQPSSDFTVYLSELDLELGTAKVSFSADDEGRLRARITDPVVSEPNNPYALALANQQPLQVVAKAEIIDGEVTMLHISDTTHRSEIVFRPED